MDLAAAAASIAVVFLRLCAMDARIAFHRLANLFGDCVTHDPSDSFVSSRIQRQPTGLCPTSSWESVFFRNIVDLYDDANI
jgi:hypothetical protein